MNPDGERIARVEQQVTDLRQDVAEVKADTKEIKTMLGEKFIQRNEVAILINDLKSEFAKEQQNIIIEVKGLKKRRWYENVGSAAAAVGLTLLIQRVFTTL